MFTGENKRVYILSNVVLDITVDRVETWREAKAGGTRIARAFAEGGVLPLTDRQAVTAYPHIFKAKSVAYRDLAPVLEAVDPPKSLKVHFSYNSLYMESGPLRNGGGSLTWSSIERHQKHRRDAQGN